MTESVALQVNLRAFSRRENARRWIATCPAVGVVTQGKSDADVRRCLQEAVELWFESCVERGVLDQALREANFRPSQVTRADVARRGEAKAGGVLGEAFEIHLSVLHDEASLALLANIA